MSLIDWLKSELEATETYISVMEAKISQAKDRAKDIRSAVYGLENQERGNIYDTLLHLLQTFGLTLQEFQDSTRKRDIVCRRQCILFCLRFQYEHISLNKLGELAGRRDHSTVIHSCRVVQEAIEEPYRVEEANRHLIELVKNYCAGLVTQKIQ